MSPSKVLIREKEQSKLFLQKGAEGGGKECSLRQLVSLYFAPLYSCLHIWPRVLGLHGEALVAGRLQSGLCEKRPGAAPVLDRDSSSWLPDGAAAGQS